MMRTYGTTSLAWVEAHAEYLLAIGQETVYLDDDGPRPWSLVTSVDSGGLMRFGLSVSLRFTAPLPCGVSVSWSVDIERQGANGSPAPVFNAETISGVIANLPEAARGRLRKWAVGSLGELEKQRSDWDKSYAGLASAEAMCRRAIEAC